MVSTEKLNSPVFDPISKHLEVRQKYSAARLLSVFDILLKSDHLLLSVSFTPLVFKDTLVGAFGPWLCEGDFIRRASYPSEG